MGCGMSFSSAPIDQLSPPKSQNGSTVDISDAAGDHFQQSNTNAQSIEPTNAQSIEPTNAQSIEPAKSSTDPKSVLRVERFVAFEIPFNSSAADSNGIDSIFMRPLPQRLRHLAPLDNPPVLSVMELAEKQTRAEEKRQKSLERRKAKAQRESNKLASVLQNRDEEPYQVRVETATRKREAQLRALQRKQQFIQERGRLARQRVKRMQQEETSGLDFEIEKFDDKSNPEESQDYIWCTDEPIKQSLFGLSKYVSHCSSVSSEVSNKEPVSVLSSYMALTNDEFFDQQVER